VAQRVPRNLQPRKKLVSVGTLDLRAVKSVASNKEAPDMADFTPNGRRRRETKAGLSLSLLDQLPCFLVFFSCAVRA